MCSILRELPSRPFPQGYQIATPAPGITSMLKKKKGGKKWGVQVQLYLFLLSGKAYSSPEDICSGVIGQNRITWLHVAAKETGKRVFLAFLASTPHGSRREWKWGWLNQVTLSYHEDPVLKNMHKGWLGRC